MVRPFPYRRYSFPSLHMPICRTALKVGVAAVGLQYVQRQNAMIAARPDLFMRIDAADDFARVKGVGRIGILLPSSSSTRRTGSRVAPPIAWTAVCRISAPN
jgi:hypothetical protein